LFGLGAPDDFDGRDNTNGRHARLRREQRKQRGEYVLRGGSCHFFSISQCRPELC